MTKTTNDRILLGIAIIAAIALFMLGRCNGIKSVIKNTTIDTVITLVKGDTVYVPEIVGVTNTVYKPKYITVTKYDTLWGAPTVIVEPVDTSKILADYFATRLYSDTQRLARGTVIIDDNVSQNRITKRRLQTFGTDTTITKTVVLKPPRNFVVSFKASILGNFGSPIYGQGVGLNFKFPSDGAWDVGLFNIPNHRPMFMLSKSWPIHLFKRK